MAGKDYLVVIVIDIRSAFSRYVYKFRTDSQRDQTKIIVFVNNGKVAIAKNVEKKHRHFC